MTPEERPLWLFSITSINEGSIMSGSPLPIRLRRNRKSSAIRNLTRETELNAADLIAPFFILEGTNIQEPVPSMPGIDRFSVDRLIPKIEQLQSAGIQAVALFPVIDPMLRSEEAEEAWNPNGLIPAAVRMLKAHFPSLCIIADVALDPFTTHGHDGVLNSAQEVDNDATVERLMQMAVVLAEAGADFVAPSDMMDGRVGAIREALDSRGFENTGILAYSAKYASALYGPFRDALQVNLQFGDKRTYQMDPANAKEALLEAILDEEEGADILMVKPALFYLDVISKLRQQTLRPIAAYHVSGEYAMVMAAAKAGYLDAGKVFYEALTCIKRAGADMIFTYAIDAVIEQL